MCQTANWKKKKRIMESTSFSTLRHTEFTPDDLSCFGFSFAVRMGLTSDKWLVVAKKKNLLRMFQGHFYRLSSEDVSSV